MKLAIGSDHAGYSFKMGVLAYLEEKGLEYKDYGTYSEASVDYPDFAHPVANAIENKEFELGILICGSGNGIAITANKHQGIRAALCWKAEIAALARQHNNANILCLPARFITIEEGKQIIDTFFSAQFEGGRHADRINKMSC